MPRRAHTCFGLLLLSGALGALLACQSVPMSQNNEQPNNTPPGAADTPAADDFLSIHRRAIVVDMHADTVQRMIDEGTDINQRLADGHFDAVRAREGGLDAQFFSIWVEPEYFGVSGQQAIARADRQIAAVRALATEHPEIWALATTAEDVRRSAGAGKLAALMGLEGGYAIDEKIEHVEKYYNLGVRYMSPAWSVSTSWAGSSGDAVGATRGLNEFGRAVIREMNRLGMMVDVSHVSDKTFWDIIETSTKPVVATHSAVRALVNVPRNLSDEQLRALAQTGGVCCVVFYPAFIEPGWKDAQRRVDAEIAPLVAAANNKAHGTPAQHKLVRDRVREREYLARLPPVSVARLVDHIDYIVKLVGIDHVGIGSDFDGTQAVPRDLASVADLPNLTKELLRRGYSETDIAKILGGNMLRLMAEVERGTTGQQAAQP